MANVLRELLPQASSFPPTGFAQYIRNQGTAGPVTWLAYDAAATESAFWELGATVYGSGPITVDVVWGAATATSGVVRWEAQLAAITPETDTVSAEAKTFATAAAVDDTHLGTTAKRLMRATLTLSAGSLDTMASGDELWVKVSRLGGHANDTLAGDALLHKVLLTWSDT
ncbi:hypothetical protein [Streptosporangium canum]|uniref:hypothetical protein n=1 Tax=Streptosporangium canum TaxID=324952 RepID=UPI0037A1BAED